MSQPNHPNDRDARRPDSGAADEPNLRLAAAADKLARITREYAQRLGGKLDAVETAYRACKDLEDSREHLLEFRNLAHKVHGTAGSYGFEDVSRAFGDVEDLADEILTSDGPVSGDMWSRLDEAMNRCSELVSAAAARS